MNTDKLSNDNQDVVSNCKGNLCSQQKVESDMMSDTSHKLQPEKSDKLMQCKDCPYSNSRILAKDVSKDMKEKQDYEKGVFETQNFAQLHPAKH